MDNYWATRYGPRSRDFFEGVKAAIETFGIWKDGVQRIGCMEMPIKEAIENARVGLDVESAPIWPEASMEEVVDMVDQAVGVLGEGRGAKVVVDKLRSLGVRIKGEPEEKEK